MDVRLLNLPQPAPAGGPLVRPVVAMEPSRPHRGTERVTSWTMGREAWRKASRAYLDESWLRRLKQKLRWSVVAALDPASAQAWFETIETPLMRPFAQANPRLAFTPMRAYLSSRWRRDRRAKVLLDTYRMAGAGPSPLRQALAGPLPVELLAFPLDGLGDVSVLLGRDQKFRKEGELALFLQCGELGGRIASLAFSLEQNGPGWTVLVGCVQGGVPGQADPVRRLTKAMHGLRPKALMVFLVQEVARALGAGILLGAGSAIQVHRRKHAVHIPWLHKLSFDYDALWRECGGLPAHDGWYRLPLKFRERPPEDLKVNKRTQYAKRYALLRTHADRLESRLAR
jgi:uncharacterized protein VirK/YbjX